MRKDSIKTENFSTLVKRALEGDAGANNEIRIRVLTERVKKESPHQKIEPSNENSREMTLLHQQLVTLLAEQPQHSHALNLLGGLYLIGFAGFEKNVRQGIALIEQAIERGNVNAMRTRALLHVYGEDDGPVNYPAAIALFEQAIKLKDPQAMLHIQLKIRNAKN